MSLEGFLLARPGHWLQGKEGTLRPFGPFQAVTYFAIGVYADLVFSAQASSSSPP